MIKPTTEQSYIFTEFKKFSLVVIQALAGTGKTTTLSIIAQQNINLKGLYLVFNKDNKYDAKKTFPKNFKIYNIHSYASFLVRRFTNLSLENVRNYDYKEYELKKIFNIDKNTAKKTLQIFTKFLNSALLKIDSSKSAYAAYAAKFYEMMENNEITLTHNFYLKYIQLKLINKEIKLGYDIVMMDEYQDTNMVTLSIVNEIDAKYKILVGDDHQQIYGWRDAINAMSKIKAPKIFPLTEGFRFPQYIADYGNKVLKFKGESLKLKSNLLVDEKYNVYKKDLNHVTQIRESSKERCYITRSNSSLIKIARRLLFENKKFKTIRKPDDIFSLAEEVYFLSVFRKDLIKKHNFLLDFDNIEEFYEDAKSLDDVQSLSAFYIVKDFGSEITTIKEAAIKYYDGYYINKKGYHDYLSTAFTAKGKEWDYVIVEDGFSDLIKLIVKSGCDSIEEFRKALKLEQLEYNFSEEINLLYVSVTRAKRSLEILDFNDFYLNLEDNEINILIEEYKKALERMEETGIFDYDPFLILNRDRCNYEVNKIIDENIPVENIYGKNSKDFSDTKYNNKNNQKAYIDKKKEALREYAEDLLQTWEKTKVENGSILINGSNIGAKGIAGVRIGNGDKIHPMEVELKDNKVFLNNNSRWQNSTIKIVDIFEKVPDKVKANFKTSKVKE